MNKLQIGNISVDCHTQKSALHRIAEMIYQREGGSVFTPNVDHVIMADSNPDFADAYARASMRLADGMPIVWASKILGTNIQERVSGADLLRPLLALAETSGFKVYLLGATEQVCKRAIKRARKELPNIQIVGHSSPMVSANPSKDEVEIIMKGVHDTKADIVIVALGAPKQELFIDRVRRHGMMIRTVFLGLGAALDFYAGNIQRAPKFMRQSGMEWFWRLCQEPKRMTTRYIRDLQFPIVVAKQYLRD